MADTLDLSKLLRGRVRVWNEAGVCVESSNLVVYNGADIIAKLLGGECEYKISHMYFAYENTAGTPSPAAASRTDTASDFWDLTAPEDFIRSPILQPVTFESTDTQYLHNQVTFYSVTVATAGEHGVPFGAANNSKVYKLGLVAAPGTNPETDDLLYASYVLPTALEAAGSGQISATWATEAN